MIGKGEDQDGSTFWNRFLWSFRRAKVMPMKANLESFKSTLTLLLSTMQLAKYRAAHETDS